MTAFISESLIEEWVVDRYFLSMAHAYRSHKEQGCQGELLYKLAEVLKRQSPSVRNIWKEFVQVAIPQMDKQVEEYKKMQAEFGKPKERKQPTRRRR